MIKKVFMISAAFCLLLSAGSAPADVAPDPLNQGMIPTKKENRVQMVSQDVVIHLGREWCRVDADFLLYNRSMGSSIMEVGFPTGYKDEIKELKVRKNGKILKTKKIIEREIMDPDKDPATYHWALWNMHFTPGEKTNLKVSYRVKPRKNYNYIITPYRRFLDSIEKDTSGQNPISAELSRIIEGMTSYSTGYIMITGAGWYDTIEKATVTIRHPKGAGILRWIEPAQHFTSSAKGIKWRFDYIKPDFDIKVEFSGTWTIEEEIAAVEKAIKTAGKKQGLIDHLHYLKKMKQCLASGNCVK
jgi:hypothetical protein